MTSLLRFFFSLSGCSFLAHSCWIIPPVGVRVPPKFALPHSPSHSSSFPIGLISAQGVWPVTRKDLQPRVFRLWYYRHFGWDNLAGKGGDVTCAGRMLGTVPASTHWMSVAPHTPLREPETSPDVRKRSLGRKCAADFRAVVLDIYI